MFAKYKRKNIIIVLVLVIAVGLLLRLLYFLDFFRAMDLTGDAQNYHIMSRQLVDDGVYGYGFGVKSKSPDAFVPPIYPLFLSAVYVVVHDQYLQITIVRLLQVFIGGAIIPLLAYLFASRVFKRTDVALLTAFFTVIYPTYIQSTVMLLTEVISLATMLLYFYLMAAALQEKKTWLNLCAGAAFALHILVRPAMLPLFVVPFIYVWLTHRKDREDIGKAFIQVSLAFVVLMLPWWIRNYVVLGELILTSSGSGNPLLAGTYPNMEGLFKDVGKEIMGSAELQGKYAIERIIKGFTTEPLTYLWWYTLGKTAFMFKKPWLLGLTPSWEWLHLITHNIFLWAGLVGMAVTSFTSRLYKLFNLYGLMFLVLYLIFIPVERYMYQHMFFLMLSAASLICITISRLAK